MFDVIVIGGGLAGLINAIMLARENRQVLLLERKVYPFHRVCGEYISNEVKPFLKSIDCYPEHFVPSNINRFQLTSTHGKSAFVDLELGGFGLSRFKFDHFLSQKAHELGVELQLGGSVMDVSFNNEKFTVHLSNGESYSGKTVIGSFGKRSVLDKSLSRAFMDKRSPYVGIKYHLRTGMDEDLIALHNFQGGYCGIVRIEDEKYNLCYLVSRDVLKNSGSIPQMERLVLMENPWLDKVFRNSDFETRQPEVINEVSFASKEPVYRHVLMCGDAAGMIAPLCGNGMAMAIHSAKICAETVQDFLDERISRDQMERNYSQQWKKNFARRLWIGRKIQNLFGTGLASEYAVKILKSSNRLSKYLIRQTHGKPF